MTKLADYDVIIIGSGLAGASMAAVLSNMRLKIALIDAQASSPQENRFLAINYGSYCLLDKIKVWSLLRQHIAPINAVHVSHQNKFGQVYFHKDDITLPALGYVVPAQQLNYALEELLLNTNCQVIRPATVIDVALQENVILTLERNGQTSTLTAQLIIAADGINSKLRQLLNIATTTIDYQQSALVTITQFKHQHRCTAYERFVNHGAIALLPLSNAHEYATIWTHDTSYIAALMSLTQQELMLKLQHEFGCRLGKIIGLGPCQLYPLLRYSAITQPIKDKVVFIGNAAYVVHPLAAQGLNLAWAAIYQLWQQIARNIMHNNPLSDNLHLKIDKTNLYFSHYLQQLFNCSNPTLNNLRQLGMLGFDLCQPLKNYFTRKLSMADLAQALKQEWSTS